MGSFREETSQRREVVIVTRRLLREEFRRRDLATTERGDSDTEIASWGVSEKRPRNDGKG
ncbi:MAG: hypothetical protein FWG98_05200 [Candidatus Cloacimonetes bacterium]|nr:hypothetical protein [Candidatus Cloacimonadota bacterium]